MIKRTFLSFSVVVLLVFSTFGALLQTTQANAFSGTLPACSGTIPATSAIQAANSSYDPTTYQYIVFNRANTYYQGSSNILIIAPTPSPTGNKQMYFSNDGTDTWLHFGNLINTYKINPDASLTEIRDGGSPALANSSFTDTTCISGTHNWTATLNSDSTYTGGLYTIADTPPPLYASCAALDFSCYFGNVMAFFGVVGNFITGFFTTLGTAFTNLSISLVQGFAMIFIPPSNAFPNLFLDIQSTISSKLGFLTYPATFFTNLFGTVFQTSNTSYACDYSGSQGVGELGLCTIAFGPFFGSTFTFNYGWMASTFPALWTIFQSTVIGTTSITLIFMYYRKLLEVLKA